MIRTSRAGRQIAYGEHTEFIPAWNGAPAFGESLSGHQLNSRQHGNVWPEYKLMTNFLTRTIRPNVTE